MIQSKNICSKEARHFLSNWEEEDSTRYINTRSKCLMLMSSELLSELSRKAYFAWDITVQEQFDKQMKLRRSESQWRKGISADDIKANVSITDFVGQYVWSSRFRPGSLIKCPLPDHADGTPSFLVIENKWLFVCYWCWKKGSVIDFVMEMEWCDFKEALKRLSGQL